MSTREATLSSDDTLSIHNSSTHSKFKCSIPSWVAHVKAKCRISKPKLLENKHNTASNTSDNDDHHDVALALSDLISQDLDFMKEEIEKVKNYVDHVDGQINQACQNFKELQKGGSRKRELHEVKKAVAKLKSQIPSQLRIHSTDSKPHRNSWPDINKSSDEMMQLYMEPKSERTMDSDSFLKAFSHMGDSSRHLLFCFFLFPPKAVIKRRVIIYLRISSFLTWREDYLNDILDGFIHSGFIEPVYQKYALVPDSLRMPLSVRSALSNEAMGYVNTSKYNTGEITECWFRYFSTVLNVDNAIIDGKLLEKGTDLQSLYLGRWQSSATHHIEVADNQVL
ncbi:Kinase and exchange factor for Rac A like, partial [Actinidia chinensis var. chinensis]